MSIVLPPLPLHMTEDETPRRPCRCEFVYNWLAANEKYFPLPPPLPKLITRVSQYTYGPSDEHFFYSQPIDCITKDVRLPYIIPAPHRISPMIPVPPLNYQYNIKMV